MDCSKYNYGYFTIILLILLVIIIATAGIILYLLLFCSYWNWKHLVLDRDDTFWNDRIDPLIVLMLLASVPHGIHEIPYALFLRSWYPDVKVPLFESKESTEEILL